MSDRTCILTGWWLFIACSFLFFASGALNGDILSMAGSAAFFAANIAFMTPIYRDMLRGRRK
ncbi:MAG: hypothetical protein ACE5FS_11940 [Paracoccaceae bacterium]